MFDCLRRTRRKKEEGSGDELQHGQQSSIPLSVRVDRPTGEIGEEKPGTSSVTEVRAEQPPREEEDLPGTSSMSEEDVKLREEEKIYSIIQQMRQGSSKRPQRLMHPGFLERHEAVKRHFLRHLVKVYDEYKKHTCKELRALRSRLILDVEWYITDLGPKYENVTNQDFRGNTPLHYAVMGNCLQFVTSYLNKHPGTLNEQNQEDETPLLIAAKLNNFKVFQELMYRDADVKCQCKDGEKTSFHYAAINGNMKMTKLLVKTHWITKANKTSDSDGRTPLSYAAEEGNEEVASMLVKYWEALLLKDNNWMYPVHYAAKNGHTDVIRVLLQDSIVLDHLKSKSNDGNNCMDLAIEGNHRETVLALISTTNWKELFRIQSESNPSPFRKLILKMPDAAREVLNRCITTEGNKDNLKVTLDYEFLEDVEWDKDRSYQYPDADKLRDHPLTIMVTEKRWELLEHPVVSALLRKKWRHGIGFYIFNIILYLVFLIGLMVFAMTIEAPFQSLNTSAMANISYEHNATRYMIPEFEDQMKSTSAMANISSEHNATRYMIPEFEDQMKRNSAKVDCSSSDNSSLTITKMGKWAVIILSALNLFVEAVKRYNFFKKGLYFEEKGHVMEWIACIFALLFAIVNGPDSGCRPLWQWSLGIISIILSWTRFFSQFQKLEFLSLHIILLKRIFKEFLKFFVVVCLPLVVVFVFCFYILFRNQKEFGSWAILVKTTAMMIVEVEFNEMFFGEDVHTDFISFFAFFIFLVFMTLLVANITIGIAVDKIREFRTEAPAVKKEMQIKFVFALERHAKQLVAIPRRLRRLFGHGNEEPEENISEVPKVIYFPNKLTFIQKSFARAWNLTEEDIMTAKNSGMVMKPTNKELLFPLKTELIALEDDINDINDDMKSLESNLMTKVKTFTEDIHKEFKQDVTKYMKSVTSSLNEETEKISKQNEVNTMELKSSIDSVQNTMKEEVKKYIQMEVLTVKEDIHEALKSVTSSLKEVAEKIGEQRK